MKGKSCKPAILCLIPAIEGYNKIKLYAITLHYVVFVFVGGDGKTFLHCYRLCIDVFAPTVSPRSQTGSRHKMWRYFNFFKHFIIYYAYIFIPGQALWVSCLAGQRNIRNVTHLHKCIFKLLINGCALWLRSTSELHHAHVFSPLACRALVDEMEWVISQIDPKKMIQTGSFRINPDGSQSVREVTYLSFIMT